MTADPIETSEKNRAPSTTAINALASPTFIEARTCLDRGDPDCAAQAFDALIAVEPLNSIAHCLRAEVELRRQRFADAEPHFRRCLALAPGYLAALHGLAYAIFRQGRLAEAAGVADRLLGFDPTGVPGRLLRAAIAATVGDHDAAQLLYRGILGERPDHVPSLLALGHCYRIAGQADQAAAAYRQALHHNPNSGEAWGCLANLKIHAFSDADLAAMSGVVERGNLPAAERLFVHFALGKALFDRRDDAGAFAHYGRGKALARSTLSPDPISAERWSQWAEATARACVARSSEDDGGAIPVFIVGMPRSGTTLVEQIIGSHSQVEATSELPYLDLMARRIVASGDDLQTLDLRGLGDEYLAAALAHRKTGKRWFIDKMPVNWRHVGLIRAILPQARIVDVRRHPLASCVAIFRQNFLGIAELAGSPRDIAGVWRGYARTMARFDRALPGAVHRLRYEQLVADTETEVRRLLDAIGLPFEDGCLRWFENGQPVRTPSSEQVRQPIFRTGLDEWRRFESELDQAKSILAGEIASYWDEAGG